MKDDDLTISDQAALDALDDILADPSVWAEPPVGLQEQIVAAIAEAQGAGRRTRRSLRLALIGAAASVLLAVGGVVGFTVLHHDNQVQFAAALSGTDLSPGASGEVILTKTSSGWRIYLDAKGLPRRANGDYYEAWLKSPGGVLVPVGTFNNPKDVTMWAGVPPTTHPTFTVTRQLANGNPASSGEVVLKGETSPK